MAHEITWSAHQPVDTWVNTLALHFMIYDEDVIARATVLATMMTHPNRRYHDLNHVAWMMSIHLYGHGGGVVIPEYVKPVINDTNIFWAILAHDCVYEGDRTDVENSANAARLIMGPHYNETIHEMIMATDNHFGCTPSKFDVSHFIDLDLAALAANADMFNRNTRNLKEEAKILKGMNSVRFNEARKAFTKTVIQSPSIYRTDTFKRLEERARTNMSTSLDITY